MTLTSPFTIGRVVVAALACQLAAAPVHAQDTSPDPAAAGQAATAPAAERPPFDEWLEGVRADAVAAGIGQSTIDAALAGLEPVASVMERDRTQAEFTLTLDQYVARRLTKKLVRDTAAASRKYRTLLGKVARAYGVPAPVVVSVWALESNLGRFSGVRPTIATLATLAWEGRRGDFFRAELLDALRIVDRGDIELARLKGSWAGALGQVQFMPSSYLQYAEDFDGDGRRDIWSSHADVFASIANYLRAHGWSGDEGWGREVRLPADRTAIDQAAPLRADGCRAERDTTVPLAIDEWRRLGVRTRSGGALGGDGYDASLFVTSERAFLLHPSYGALLEYNCAHAYALSVGLLSDRVAATKGSTGSAAHAKSGTATKSAGTTKTKTTTKATAEPEPEPKHTRPVPPRHD